MVMPNMPTDPYAETGPGTAEGRRPTIVPGPAAASPELTGRPRRRTFSVQDKLRVLAETDRAAGTGGVGAICGAKDCIHRSFRIGDDSVLPGPLGH